MNVEYFPLNKGPIMCGIRGVLWEEKHGLRKKADCVLRLFERNDGFYVLKLTDIWAD